MPKETKTVRWDGMEIEITRLGPSGAGVKLDVDAPDDRRWRLDVTRSGNYEVLTTWNSDGDLDDVAEPPWLGDVLEQVRARAV
jgi:hypothetical protein